MKSDVSDVGSHGIIYTEHTPVSTASRRGRGALGKDSGISPGSSGLGKRHMQQTILSPLLVNKYEQAFLRGYPSHTVPYSPTASLRT